MTRDVRTASVDYEIAEVVVFEGIYSKAVKNPQLIQVGGLGLHGTLLHAVIVSVVGTGQLIGVVVAIEADPRRPYRLR